jgi:hypothetical protein
VFVLGPGAVRREGRGNAAMMREMRRLEYIKIIMSIVLYELVVQIQVTHTLVHGVS